MVHVMRVNTLKARKRAMVDLHLQMGVITKVSSYKMKLVGMATTIGLMANRILGTGLKIKWTEKEFLLGRMGRSMKEPLLTTNVRVMVHLYGQMVASTLVTGSRVSNMAMEHISARKDFLKRVSGRMVGRLA